ncbi:MAG TPA: nuclear transport factor 2 family protein [Chitinophagaceae bacterium]|nr:nuclear transport factor 2 family protein [Chitinophagaceae bacterium]
MDTNQQTIQVFYTAFQNRDHKTMSACYCEDIIFSDPVFGILKGDEVRYMWEMLCNHAIDLRLACSDIRGVDEEYYTCRWRASYTFSPTGRRVVNDAKAFMRLKNGVITEHSDAYRLSTWIGQALGWKGVMFGWTGFMKRSVQRNARKSLVRFIEKKARAVGSL